MKVYTVYKKGVYRQGTVGTYSSLPLAMMAIDRAKELEPDDYHSFEIEIIGVDDADRCVL